ncbi:MAG: hypothetical protein A07HR60_01548 [uncultured archaeon A07HR60]|nr:MAG: hypothetical protein A07HR60_01548 [uncultured archaeon A07HR60]
MRRGDSRPSLFARNYNPLCKLLSVAYVVAVKSSARKRNAKVGRFVLERGTHRELSHREAAERWAAELSAGDGHVWIAAAHPADQSDANGYLVSRATNDKLEAAHDKRRRRLRGGTDHDQNTL